MVKYGLGRNNQFNYKKTWIINDNNENKIIISTGSYIGEVFDD